MRAEILHPEADGIRFHYGIESLKKRDESTDLITILRKDMNLEEKLDPSRAKDSDQDLLGLS